MSLLCSRVVVVQATYGTGWFQLKKSSTTQVIIMSYISFERTYQELQSGIKCVVSTEEMFCAVVTLYSVSCIDYLLRTQKWQLHKNFLLTKLLITHQRTVLNVLFRMRYNLLSSLELLMPSQAETISVPYVEWTTALEHKSDNCTKNFLLTKLHILYQIVALDELFRMRPNVAPELDFMACSCCHRIL